VGRSVVAPYESAAASSTTLAVPTDPLKP